MTMIAACMAAGAMAQVQIGPKVGMNLYKIADGEDVSEGVNEPFAVGLNLGVATSFGITENFAIAPELIFTQKGSRLEGEFTDSFSGDFGQIETTITFDERQKLNYLEMPVLARVTFGNTVKGYVNAGPSVGYWLGGSLKSEEGDESETYKIKFVDEGDDVADDEISVDKERANRLEVGAAIGGGVMVNTGAGDLLFDVRYQRGLNNIFDYEDDDLTAKNHGFAVSVIYLLGSK